ncbi:glutathione S-transferase family protein [Phyllobacterium myrsinacearum]|uniref:Glutathione S-transferase n=1 Tax=Phyllobacterium myrsinacearum TaxID=28101 RepID=A0A2S9JPE1_9HYPH|nr:glutathione S-transferase family protein [Phyllobacterium myrsinacearum]PRD55055.1 glutathione S-transferase [Phyllobacterium myrsinacearum]PWV90389.1 glutathione S-transferase [Phyllobacterium myrsinacearum]RZV05417.1 glutathione S-transferase [Phyllobacterium myrsinacearum]
MSDIILTTFDWVPEMPRGMVRDLRVRWALQEAGLAYRVESTPFRDRGPDHFAAQPFGQVPWLTDGDLIIFESGAILLHLAEKSAALMPTDSRSRAEVVEWVIAALNSVDLPSQPWALFRFMGYPGESPEARFVDDFLKARLERMEAVLASRDWLAAGRFTVADLLMADVLRQVDRFDGLTRYPACCTYVARATARPAFLKAYDEQMAHFAAGDAA